MKYQQSTSGPNQDFVASTDYDKLCMSLLSGLPNEQELALNVCTILSNEGNYMLHLEKTPRLVNLLLCQAGVWPTGDSALKEVYLEGWEGVPGRNMRRFWRSTLTVKYPKLLELCDWNLGEQDEDESLLNLEVDLGALNVEGQRVLRVALILHNLSFEKNNVPMLVSNENFLRFLLLCMHSSWSDLKQTAYDTLANLACEIQLSIEKNMILSLVFQTLMDGIKSSDRFLIIKSMDILSQLCNCEQNEDVIPSRIEVEVYEQMVSFLTVRDIMLLFYTLEVLYALSDLGRYACEKIINVHKSIGALVSLLTLEPSQYGSAAQIRVKVVETLVPVEQDPEPKETSNPTPVVSSHVSDPKLEQKINHSPILKAQLSAPPRSDVNSSDTKTPLQPALPVCKPVSPSSSSYTPVSNSSAVQTNSGSSMLIKSLLAKEVQQRSLQRQLHVQPNVRKVLICTSEKPSGVNRTPSAAQDAVVCAVRPGPMPQSRVTMQFARAPMQASMITNRARMVATAPPRVMKTSPILTSKIQPVKQTVTNTTVRPNGTIHGVQFEVSSQKEEAKMVMDCSSVHATHIKPTQNRIAASKPVVDSTGSIFNCESARERCYSSDNEKNSALSANDVSSSCVASALTQSSFAPGNFMSTQSNYVNVSESGSIEKSKISSVTSCVQNTLTLAVPTQVAANSISVTSPQSTSAPTLVKSVLSHSGDYETEVIRQQMDKGKMCRQAPLLNGLLNKDKVPLSKELNPVTIVQNGNKSNNSLFEVSSEEKCNNSAALSSTVVTIPFASNGNSLMQLCTGQTTLSGTVEVQPDQKGVVRLHIESPENSNQGSDLSSISDITRTLECASKAISQTNADCTSHVPFTCVCETRTMGTVITANTPTLTRPGQQIIVVTPALSQPQLCIQSPNMKFSILHSIPKVDDIVSPISFSRVSLNPLNQIRQTTIVKTPSISTATVKRPSSDSQKLAVYSKAKKARLDTKTPLLEATLKLPTSVSSPVATNNINTKLFHDNQPLLPKSAPVESPSKLTTAKAVAVPLQNVDFPSEKEARTFSGLSSAGDHAPAVVITNVPSKSTSKPTLASKPTPSSSSSKLEYVCEWKDCNKKFSSPGAVLVHAGRAHAPYCSEDMICLWKGCDSMKRRRFSLLTHLQDWHCNERVLNIQAMRRKQLAQQGKTSIAAPQMPPPHPGYAPDAAILAIRRHAAQYMSPKELSEEKESALTKSIRLTSALILRNLVTHSSLARSYLRCYEPELVCLAMSPIESSRTIAQCLSELASSHE